MHLHPSNINISWHLMTYTHHAARLDEVRRKEHPNHTNWASKLRVGVRISTRPAPLVNQSRPRIVVTMRKLPKPRCQSCHILQQPPPTGWETLSFGGMVCLFFTGQLVAGVACSVQARFQRRVNGTLLDRYGLRGSFAVKDNACQY
jgi:hypothetical protein